MRYAAGHEDPHAAHFSAMPPPSSLDSGSGKGRGKGKGKGKWEDSGMISDGIHITNLPADLNSLDVLHRHFRRFGEISKITTDIEKSGAFVQFSDRTAAEAAVAVPLYDRADVILTLAQRARTGGKGRGAGGKGKILTGDGRPAENRVLVCDREEHERVVATKRKKDEVDSKKAQLLGAMTDQLKMIMSRLATEGLSDEKKDSYRKLMMQIKEKIDNINGAQSGGAGDDGGRMDPPKVPKGKSKGKEEWQTTGKWTLDLRTRVIKMQMPQGWSLEKLREELRKLIPSEEALQDLAPDVKEAKLEPGATPEAMLLRFKDRSSAEQLFGQRADLPFTVEWWDQPFPESAALPAMLPTPPKEELGADVAQKAEAVADQEASAGDAAGLAAAVAEAEEQLPAWDDGDEAAAGAAAPAESAADAAAPPAAAPAEGATAESALAEGAPSAAAEAPAKPAAAEPAAAPAAEASADAPADATPAAAGAEAAAAADGTGQEASADAAH